MGYGECRGLEWETEVGVRVGVRNRLGEAIGKPVANLHRHIDRALGRSSRKGQKDRAPVSSNMTGLFSACRFFNRFVFIDEVSRKRSNH